VRRVKLPTGFPRLKGHALFQRMCSPKPVSPASHRDLELAKRTARYIIETRVVKSTSSQLFTLNKFVRPIFLLKSQKAMGLVVQIKVPFDTVWNIMGGSFIVTVVASMNYAFS
jgi:hypothetical protein